MAISQIKSKNNKQLNNFINKIIINIFDKLKYVYILYLY